MPPKQKEAYKLKLPAVLAAELGHSGDSTPGNDRRPRYRGVQNRKVERAQKRATKKTNIAQAHQAYKIARSENQRIKETGSTNGTKRSHKQSRHRPNRNRGNKHQKHSKGDDKSESEDSDNDEDENQHESKQSMPIKVAKSTKENADQPKSILKRTKQPDKDIPATNDLRSPSPPPRVSRAIKQQLEQDDAEIAALEKRLGIKSKKLPQSFKDDGLDDLLDGIDDLVGLGDDSEEDSKGRKRKRKRSEDEEWLAKKRQKAGRVPGTEVDDEQSDEEEFEDMDDLSDEDDISENNFLEDEDLEEDEALEDDEFNGFESESSPQPEKRVRENPYVAPTTGMEQSTAKYVPPSLRKPSASDSEDLIRLRRQLQGLVNRLTDANLISILGDIEKIYRTNARQHVTSTLVDLLLTSVCEPTSLPDTLIILPAGFIAAIYKIIGTDFGAQIIQRIVELFEQHYESASELGNDGPEAATFDGRKETANLITLLSELYNFQVVGSTLVFDYIRRFLGKLSELNTELLLRVIRISGPQLRQDDPSSLKDIVTMLRPAIASVGEANLSVRTKFMIETINDLKNNKMKTGAAASAVVSEHTKRMKKTIGSLNTRSIKASEPLRIGLKDIQDSDKKGKWWLVGASWAGNDAPNSKTTDSDIPSTGTKSSKSSKVKVKDIDNDPTSTDLLQMARDHRMNTDIRRSIFITIMSATDYQDAHLRLLKLNLKKAQELEIPKVLLHCAAGEKNYNPYYTLIAKKLCQGDRKLKMGFQFCAWDLYKRMGVNDEDGEYEGFGEGELELREIVNLAKLFGTLIADNSLNLTILKKLTLNHLQEKAKIFVEILFITIFLEGQKGRKELDEAVVRAVVERVKGKEGAGDEEVRGLVVGMQWFLRKVVRKSDLAGGEREREVVGWACGVAGKVLLEEGSDE